MRHPTEDVLHWVIDNPAGVAHADRQHVAHCPQCLRGIADASHGRTGTAVAKPPARSLWSRLRHPAAAAVAVAAVVTGASAAAANDWLPIFRTQQVVPVSFTTDDLISLPDLSAYGDVNFTGDPNVHEVPDAATATAETGLEAPQVDLLPSGVTGEPAYSVGEKVTATFTFSAAQAAEAAAEAGETLPAPPPGLDGAAVRLEAGPGLAAVWSSTSGAPALVVGRAVAPTAYSSGVPFETARDYLLSLPGLPDDIAEQLRTFAADGSSLPLPVPEDRVTTTTTELNGNAATVLTTRDRTLAAVVWVDNGVVSVVAGSLDDDEVLAVARGLR
jgi:hypothetical protein